MKFNMNFYYKDEFIKQLDTHPKTKYTIKNNTIITKNGILSKEYLHIGNKIRRVKYVSEPTATLYFPHLLYTKEIISYNETNYYISSFKNKYFKINKKNSIYTLIMVTNDSNSESIINFSTSFIKLIPTILKYLFS